MQGAYFDGALNEQCFLYGACEALVPFIEAGKAVFGMEYELEPEEFCPEANAMHFDWLNKNYELDASRQSCRQGLRANQAYASTVRTARAV
jgi:hypothetical protein